ncbi:MAG: RagB/SusD family nutrient uptake outer membrane protein [Bacteroidota bacterium]
MTTTYKKLAIILVFLFSLSSCDSLLDLDAENNFSLDDLSTTENIERALSGAYYGLGGFSDGFSGGELYGGDFILISELISKRSDVAWLVSSGGADHEAFFNHNIVRTNPIVEANWVRGYEVINLINNVLANLDNVTDPTTRNRINGEALAIRAAIYFEMVRLWAPQYSPTNISEPALPLITEPVASINEVQNPSKATVGQIYTQIENDLTNASALLESFGKNGVNISYFACQAFLARVSVQKNDFASALTHANNIIDANEFTLLNNALDAFNNLSNSPEDIFAIQQTLANNAGDRTTGVGLTTYVSALTESGFGVLGIIDTHLFSRSPNFTSPSFYSEDERVQINLNIDEATTSDAITTAFYRNPVNTGLLASSKYIRADHVIPVIRLAEIYLIRAEALYELNPGTVNTDALAALNVVRERAGIEALQTADFADPSSLYDSIAFERKRELLFEGHLLHDLRRTRMFKNDPEIVIGIERFGENPLNTDLILPIPQSETDASGLN